MMSDIDCIVWQAYTIDRENGVLLAQPAAGLPTLELPVNTATSDSLWSEASLGDALMHAKETKWFRTNTSQTHITKALLQLRPDASWSKQKLSEQEALRGMYTYIHIIHVYIHTYIHIIHTYIHTIHTS